MIKNIIRFGCAAVLALGLSACDNKTKQKVVTGGIIDAAAGIPTSVAPAQTAAASVATARAALNMVNSSMNAASSGGSSFHAPATTVMSLGRRAIQPQSDGGVVAAPDANGWVIFTYAGTGYDFIYKYRLLDASGAPITATQYYELWEGATYKTFEYYYKYFYDLSLIPTQTSEDEYSNGLVKYDGEGSTSWTYDTPGTWTSGGLMNGSFVFTMTYKDGVSQSFTSEINNLRTVYDSTLLYKYKTTSGYIKVSYASWNFFLQYNSDGSADGTMSGQGYAYTIHITAPTSTSYGTATYTDANGVSTTF